MTAPLARLSLAAQRAYLGAIVHRRARVAPERIPAKPLPPLTEAEWALLRADLDLARRQGLAVVRVDMRRAPIVQSDRPVTIRAARD